MAKKKEDSKAKESKEEVEKTDEIKEGNTEEVEETGNNIVDEEKEAETEGKEQDYNSIFDDEYDPDADEDSKEKEEEVAEEVLEEEVAEEEEADKTNNSSSDSSSSKKNKSDKDKKKDNKEKEKESSKEDTEEAALDEPAKKKKSSPKKKILIVIGAILLLLVGAFLGWRLFSMRNEIKEVKEETPAPTTTEPEKKESKVVYVTADNGLNMRESADSASKSLVIIPDGTKLTVLEEKDGWYKVEYNGQTGWVSAEFVSEQKPDDMKTYTGTGFSPDGPKFSVKYPADWAIDDYKISKTAGGLAYIIALGEGGHGGNDDPAIVNTQEDVAANGVTGKKSISKKDGKIVAVYTQFLKGDGYINIEFNPPVGYEESYIDIYNKIVESFQFI